MGSNFLIILDMRACIAMDDGWMDGDGYIPHKGWGWNLYLGPLLILGQLRPKYYGSS